MSKFQDKTCEALWDLSLDGCDEECGNVADGGWYGLLVNTKIAGAEHAILFENGQGFVEYTVYKTEERARSEFESIESEIAAEYTED